MKELKQKLLAAYGPDTAHPSYPFSLDNPTAGQCAITALLVHETHGYDIYETKVGRSRHFFNKTTSGEVVDLTAEQYGPQFSRILVLSRFRQEETETHAQSDARRRVQ